MNIAFHGGQQHLAPRRSAASRLFRFHVWNELRDRFLHHTRALHDLRQEHFSGAEEIADNVHAIHQRTFNDCQRPLVFLSCLFNIVLDVIHDALDQRVLQPLFDGLLTPRVLFGFGFAVLMYGVRECQETFGRVGPAIQQDIFDEFEQVFRNGFIDRELSGIDDRHVESRADGVIQKCGMHGIADSLVPPK